MSYFTHKLPLKVTLAHKYESGVNDFQNKKYRKNASIRFD